MCLLRKRWSRWMKCGRNVVKNWNRNDRDRTDASTAITWYSIIVGIIHHHYFICIRHFHQSNFFCFESTISFHKTYATDMNFSARNKCNSSTPSFVSILSLYLSLPQFILSLNPYRMKESVSSSVHRNRNETHKFWPKSNKNLRKFTWKIWNTISFRRVFFSLRKTNIYPDRHYNFIKSSHKYHKTQLSFDSFRVSLSLSVYGRYWNKQRQVRHIKSVGLHALTKLTWHKTVIPAVGVSAVCTTICTKTADRS